MRTASNEQLRDWHSWLSAPCCFLVTAGCSLLIGLSGCGPATTDNAPNYGPGTNVSALPTSQAGSSPQ